MDSGSREGGPAVVLRRAAAGDVSALREVLAGVMAAKPQKLTTLVQVRVTEEAARRLDTLAAQIDAQTDLTVTRSDLVRAAVDALTKR